MRLIVIGFAVAGMLAIGGYAVTKTCGHSKGSAIAFDPVMSSACRFSCATQQPYEEKDVAPQPGAKMGQLTRCPVSGVVFAVDEGRPRLRHARADYVFCCDRCAAKFQKHPERFTSL